MFKFVVVISGESTLETLDVKFYFVNYFNS